MAKRKYREQDNLIELVREEQSRYVKNVSPMTPRQADLIESIQHKPVTFAVGPAGTGKTYLACVQAVEALLAGQVKRIIITRPAVASAGEELGYLPGSLENKLDPFLRPCIQAITERLSNQRFKSYLKEGVIEFVSFAHMRGRTFNNAFIIADEVQNVSVDAMKMLLTRLGFNSRMVLCGDLTQSDLGPDVASGLKDAITRFADAASVGTIVFADEDVVRSPVVAELLGCY